ncbi:hypothetical protein GOP47_0011672 [Adiantum capillus-veneris]|uniref:DUF7733 domain-containing protein n=1 Tax=Adiantum capillus-veneris TaxID=13818 RepID=A0A9D4ZFL8_ADICA|nr:hypothetical protein GOP47_0011672 [Adiantum capillus-veneris]
MSGLSLAVGPRHGQTKSDKEDDGSPKGLMGSIRTIELQLVAFIVVFSASGLVPVADLLFPVFVTPYLYFLSKFNFPTIGKEGVSMEVFHGSRMFQLYLVLGTVLGLFFPLAYVLGGFARGDQHAVRASTPHLFLLSVQILSENLVSNLAVWSPPVRAFLVAIYNTRRIFSLADWVYDAFYYVPPPEFPSFRDIAWMWFGRGLASANLVYFIINMFCFIIPRFIPRAFERYQQAKATCEASSKKIADDKGSPNPAKGVPEKKGESCMMIRFTGDGPAQVSVNEISVPSSCFHSFKGQVDIVSHPNPRGQKTWVYGTLLEKAMYFWNRRCGYGEVNMGSVRVVLETGLPTDNFKQIIFWLKQIL